MLVASAACSPAPAPGFHLLEAVRRGDEHATFRFPSRPRIVETQADHQRRQVVELPAGTWSWRGRVPRQGRLHVGLAVARPVAGELRLIVESVRGGRAETLEAAKQTLVPAPAAEPTAADVAQAGWLDLEIPLDRFAGDEIELRFTATVETQGPAPPVAWGPVMLAGARERPNPRPNVLLIVVDTLRADHVSAYGYHRETTPHVDAMLAGKGVLLEHAYAQAPWTLPSIVSLMTGRYSTELLSDRLAAFKIPPGIPSIAEHMRELGYETAAFYANPALHLGNGFDRGFDTFFAPPASFDWFNRHADDLNRRMLPWVAAHRDRPFFLYAHYLDPHDPYANEEIVDHRSPFFPGYQGTLRGDQVHELYGGRVELADPAEDVAQLTALYDSEIHYVDRFVGELLAAVGEEALANTLVVFTSDHGEELFEHGGFKHGQSLYEEQIRVPLIFRWDGRLPAGRRLSGVVELLDVLPTVISAAGGTLDPAWQGENLLPALRFEQPLPRRAAFAQHLAGGPLRAAVVLDGLKLVLFNRRELFVPPNEFEDHLYKVDLARFADAELYELAADPGETRNRAAAAPAAGGRLAALVHRRLDRRLPGLRIVCSGVPAGARLVATIELASPSPSWEPLFLAEADTVELAGTKLELSWSGDPALAPGRGIRLPDEGVAIASVRLELAGERLPPAAVYLGSGLPYGGGAVSPDSLKARGAPQLPDGPALMLWQPAEKPAIPEAEEDEETRRRLKALGYLLQ